MDRDFSMTTQHGGHDSRPSRVPVFLCLILVVRVAELLKKQFDILVDEHNLLIHRMRRWTQDLFFCVSIMKHLDILGVEGGGSMSPQLIGYLLVIER